MILKKSILISIIVLLVLASGGVYYFWQGNSSSTGVSQLITSVVPGLKKDWCQDLEKAAAEGSQNMKNSPIFPDASTFSPPPAEIAQFTEKIAEEQYEKAVASGSDITKSEFCAYYVSLFSITKNLPSSPMDAVKTDYRELQKKELEKYIGKDRAQVVMQSVETEQGDQAAKASISADESVAILCTDDPKNRLLEPKSNAAICQSPDSSLGIDVGRKWGDLDAYGGKWSGCPFQVMRDQTGQIQNFTFCATLPSGKVITCNFNGCNF